MIPGEDRKKILLYLWKNRTVYLGEAPEDPSFTPAAPVFFAGLETPLRVHREGETFEAWSVGIPVGHAVSIETRGGIIASCYLDPWGHDLAALSARLPEHRHGLFIDPEPREVFQGNLAAVYAGERCLISDAVDRHRTVWMPVPPTRLSTLLDRTVFSRSTILASPDEAIEEIIRLVRAGKDMANVADLASRVGLSQAQLSRRFQAETGLALRRFRLWNRLFVTACYMQVGRSLTDASVRAGFSDSAHFAHTFKTMIGVRPSCVLKAVDRLCIFMGDDVDLPDLSS